MHASRVVALKNLPLVGLRMVTHARVIVRLRAGDEPHPAPVVDAAQSVTRHERAPGKLNVLVEALACLEDDGH